MAAVGKILKDARERRGLSVSDVQQLTKIQKRYLESLEIDDYSAMPGTFYVRGFIRKYAEAVGLDSQKVLAIFDGKERAAAAGDQDSIKIEVDEVKGSRIKQHKKGDGKRRISWPLILLTFVVLVLVGIIIYITLKENKNRPAIIDTPSSYEVDRSTESSSSSTSSSSTESSQSSEETSASESTTETSSSEEKPFTMKYQSETNGLVEMKLENAADPLKIELTGTTGSCWVGVLVNEQYVYQGTIQASETQNTTLAKGVKDFSIVLGASGNIKIKINQKNLAFNPSNTSDIKKTIHITTTYKK